MSSLKHVALIFILISIELITFSYSSANPSIGTKTKRLGKLSDFKSKFIKKKNIVTIFASQMFMEASIYLAYV